MIADAVVLRIYSSNDVPNIHSGVPIYLNSLCCLVQESYYAQRIVSLTPSQAAYLAVERPASIPATYHRPWPSVEHIKSLAYDVENIIQSLGMANSLWVATMSVALRTS